VATTTLRPLYPEQIPDTHRKVGWGPIWNARKIAPALGFKFRVFQPLASRFTVYGLLAITLHWMNKKPKNIEHDLYIMLHKDMDTFECKFKQQVF
jgi:hypothetical protein